jgi:hypothetical protein
MINNMIIKCSKCNKEFEKGCKSSNHHICKTCNLLSQKQHYIKNRKRILKQKKIYCKENKTKIYERYNNYKLIVFKHYSQKEIPECNICGCKDIRVLEIDHINDNGNIHRKNRNGRTVQYSWFISHNYPVGYQILCANCNWKKHLENIKNKNPTYRQAMNKKTQEKLKKEVFSHYGNCCNNCGETNINILTLDHINGGGREHKRNITSTSLGNRFYGLLKKNNYLSDSPIQILCRNCQRIKVIENEECKKLPFDAD